MHEFYWQCVWFMEQSSALLGLSYEAWNVVLFLVIHPMITLIMVWMAVKYRRRWKAERTQRLALEESCQVLF